MDIVSRLGAHLRAWRRTPLAVGYALAPAFLVLMALLVHVGLLHVSLGAVATVLAVVWVVGTAIEIWYRCRPSRISAQARMAVHAAATTAANYVTGLGPALGWSSAFIMHEDIVTHGVRAWRSTAAWFLASLAVAQGLVWTGHLELVVPEPASHALAALAALGTVFVARMIAAAFAAKEAAEGELRRSEQRFRSLVQHGSDMILVAADDRITYVSEAVTRELGFSPDQLVGRPVGSLTHPEDLADVVARVEAAFAAGPGTTHRAEFRVRHADGSWRHVEAAISDLRSDPAVAGVVVNARDITERKRFEAALAHQALHDPLTGLPNRALVTDRVEHALARSGRNGTDVGVIFVDVDRFKLVNDSLGHEAGDRVLCELARRLGASVRPGDTVGRLAGDEFVVVCEGLTHPAEAVAVARRLLEAAARPVVIGDDEVVPSISVGVAVATAADGDADSLLRGADAAMYRAKEKGRNRVEVFDPAMRAEVSRRFHVESALRRALERGEFDLFYQPVLDLDDGRIVGLEALLRWRHPERGLVTPGEFVGVAEDCGLIVPIGAWVIRRAVSQARVWQDAGLLAPGCGVAVNLSVRQLFESDVVDVVVGALAEAGVAAGQLTLCLEVTETMVARSPGQAEAILGGLKALGTQLAIDDFGTGYSSLAQLARFPIDVLKVDRSFVSHLEEHPVQQVIVASVVELGRSLGVEVVAEGVETTEELQALRRLGCRFAQGFLFSRPVPTDAATELLRAGPGHLLPTAARGETLGP